MKKWLWKIGFWLIVVFIIFFPTFSKVQKLKTTDRVLSQKLERLSEDNEELTRENEMLKNDPVYIEEVAREKLKVAKENEIIFRVVDDTEE